MNWEHLLPGERPVKGARPREGEAKDKGGTRMSQGFTDSSSVRRADGAKARAVVWG